VFFKREEKSIKLLEQTTSNNIMMLCLRCSEPIWDETPFFELLLSSSSQSASLLSEEQHHQHIVCVECFGVLHGERGCCLFLLCPVDGCQSRLSGHVCHRKVQKKTRQGWKQALGMKPSSDVFICNPSKDWDPSRYYLQKSKEYQEDHMVLSISWLPTMPDATNQETTSDRGQNQTTRRMSIEVPFHKRTDELPDTVKIKLVSLMLLLHHIYFGGAGEKGEDDASMDEDLSSAPQLFNFALSDRSVLTQAMVALGSGLTIDELLPYKTDSNPYQKSCFLAFWAATEMMRRATSKRSGVLQDFIAHQLSVRRAPNAAVDLLCRFCISSSSKKIRLEDIQTVNSKICIWLADGGEKMVRFNDCI
jgi:hypothetical protein